MTTEEYKNKLGILMNTVKFWMDDVEHVRLKDLEAYVNNGNDLHKKFDELLFNHSNSERMQLTEGIEELADNARDLYFEGFTNVLFPARRALREYNKALAAAKSFKSTGFYTPEHK